MSAVVEEPAENIAQDMAETGYRYRYRWMVLAVVLVADVMDLIDATSPTSRGPRSAGPRWQRQHPAMVLAAYTLTFAVGLITSARAGDLVGRRRMFLIGMAGFTVASLLCGWRRRRLPDCRAGRPGLLRAMMIPQGLAMVKSSFAPADPEGLHPVRPDHGAGRRTRADPGRCPARCRPVRHRLADGLPDQHPDRRGRDVPCLAHLPEIRTDGPPPGWTRSARSSDGGLGAAHLPARAGPRARLGAVDLRDDGCLRVVFACSSATSGNRRTRSSSPPFPAPRLRGGTAFLASFFVAMSGFMLVLSLFLQLGLATAT